VADEEHNWLISLGFFDRGAAPMAVDWGHWLHLVFVQNGPVSSDELYLMAELATLEIADAACERVSKDVLSSTGTSISVQIVEDDDVCRVEIDGQLASGTGVRSVGLEYLTVDVADAVQEHLMEQLWRPWPECTRHRRGVHPEMAAGSAIWICQAGKHSVSRIGELTKP